MNRITRQEVSFGFTIPESGSAISSLLATVETANGTHHRLGVLQSVANLPAGPARINLELLLTVPEPPPPRPRTLRDKLWEILSDSDGDGPDNQVNAVLELLSEEENLPDQIDALLDEN